ncbi:MAG: DUF3000 domain-containing protein [Candidatus Nanopelagicales bacterium]|nr:DUF3000 domain-containing protein [Candidatus Nanopelagicales bacterium]
MTAGAKSSRGSRAGTDGTGSPRFDAALGNVLALSYRPELTITESPGPARLAPHSFALTADAHLADAHLASARLVVLHDPNGQDTWQGTLRIVAYIDADVDLEVAADPMLPEVGWSWLQEALDEYGASAAAIGGTVTQVASRSFGVMGHRPPEGRIQVRASWTPRSMDDLPNHAGAWARLIALAAGLPESSDVSSIGG